MLSIRLQKSHVINVKKQIPPSQLKNGLWGPTLHLLKDLRHLSCWKYNMQLKSTSLIFFRLILSIQWSDIIANDRNTDIYWVGLKSPWVTDMYKTLYDDLIETSPDVYFKWQHSINFSHGKSTKDLKLLDFRNTLLHWTT